MTSKKTLNIGLDMDGVIVDFMAPIYRRFNISKKDCTTYKMEDLFPDKAQEMIKFYTRKGYFKNLKPYPGALNFIKKLQQLPRVKIWYVSKPSKHSIYTWSDKIKWIKENTPELLKSTILTQDKSIIVLDIFVDDDPENFRRNASKYKFLFNQEWNKDEKHFERVKNYRELYDKIKQIAIKG